MPPDPLGPGPAVEPGMPGGGPAQVGGHVATLAVEDGEDCAGAGAGDAGGGAGAV